MSSILSAGDIAIVRFQADNPDSFSFVAMTAIASGTTITFTDNAMTSTGALATNEGTVVWTAASAIAAGTVVTFDGANANGFGAISPSASSFAFSTDGDNLFAYQGTSTSPTFIAGFASEAFITTGPTNAQQSYLPTALTAGLNAVALTTSATETDNGVYAGITSGTRAELLAAIHERTNWTLSDSIPIASAPASFSLGAVAGITVSPTTTTATEGGATGSFSVVLTSAPTANVTVTLSPNAQVTTSAASLVFTSANWNVAQTVTVTAVDDSAVEGTHAGSVVTNAATSTDAAYNGINPTDVTVTITDNDIPAFTVTPTTLAVTEGAAGQGFTVALSLAPTANVTVAVSTTGDAVADVTTLTFTTANWNIAQTVTVTAANDGLVEGTESGTVVLAAATSTDAAWNGVNPADVAVTITDANSYGFTISATTLSVTEGGAASSFTVALRSIPTADVVVPVSYGAGINGAVTSLTFTAANWNVPQTVSFSAPEDAFSEGAMGTTVTLGAATSTDLNYNGRNPADVAVTIADNDPLLAAGAIAFVGLQADNPDAFAFVLLQDIAAGTRITVTDNGWQAASGSFRSGENILVWTAPADIEAGTVIRWKDNTPDETSDGWDFTTPFGLSTAGEQITAFQGTLTSVDTLIAAITTNRSTFDAEGINTNTTALPGTGSALADLVVGSSAVAVGQAALDNDNSVYTGPTTGLKADITAALFDAANWTASQDLGLVFPTTFTFTDQVILAGTAGADTLEGGSGADSLSGLGGADLLIGRAGNDVLLGGNDNDTLSGGAGNDLLNGGTGADSMAGGTGNDSYTIDDAGDVVLELAGEGTADRISTNQNTTLSGALAEIENVTLTGSAALRVIGNAYANVLTGNSGNNTLVGGEGDDRLSGGLGADSMVGGTGNDTYTIDNVGDVVVELAGQGTDTLFTAFSTTLSGALAEIENLTLTGLGNISATGNAYANALTGNAGNNTLVGGEGNDKLNGGLGADSMVGGTGNDSYTIDNVGDVVVELAGQGIDTVFTVLSTTLSGTLAEIENLTLTGLGNISATGNAYDNALTGNAGDNTLVGGEGNDKLNGGLGADSMVGGTGNDSYTIDNAGDVVVELAGQGLDTVFTVLSTTLSGALAEIENLTLTGLGNLSATGNAYANALTGNAGDNMLEGDAGNDKLTGGLGADTLSGGIGNDTLDGGLGQDVLTGGAGNDSFSFATLAGSALATPDLITDFTLGADRVLVSAIDTDAVLAGNQAFAWIGGAAFGGAGVAQARFYDDGIDTFAAFDLGDGGDAEMLIRFNGVLALSASNFVL